MICKIRKWLLSDAEDLTVAISNKKVQDNLRDGIPYPYTVQDGINFISAMLSADENDTFAFAITVDEKAIGSIGVYRQENIHRQTAELGYYIASVRLQAYADLQERSLPRRLHRTICFLRVLRVLPVDRRL